MDLIKNLLDKYNRLGGEGERQKKVVVEVIKDLTGLKIENSQVLIRGSEIILNVPPVVKSEVFLRQIVILKVIKNHPDGFVITRIS
ncbi:MAG: hypothetical protein A2589_00360 [Candidatus Vogelbacteria bacterium RIFOXYD1_FULL_46_19]|uniref:Uncharacterized protein n=1 Tax=Candidatus Vogelbacteria bacterium RIFOXYD1_FULL_46_19 TaxID=1802439 RepID=A0A1G2QJ74_9BACT|nr:MAG: hypothetical protein A2589_00360 [Candidatus Vogelbacteria bacterium RIFOXYD1_FULL_46_19]